MDGRGWRELPSTPRPGSILFGRHAIPPAEAQFLLPTPVAAAAGERKSSPVRKNQRAQGLGCGEHLGRRDGTPTLPSVHCPTGLELHGSNLNAWKIEGNAHHEGAMIYGSTSWSLD